MFFLSELREKNGSFIKLGGSSMTGENVHNSLHNGDIESWVVLLGCWSV